MFSLFQYTVIYIFKIHISTDVFIYKSVFETEYVYASQLIFKYATLNKYVCM